MIRSVRLPSPALPPFTLADNPVLSLASPFNTVNLDRPSPLSSLIKTTAGFTGTSLTTARVIDYKPDKIEDFVVAYCPSCEEPFVLLSSPALTLANSHVCPLLSRLPKGSTKCVEHDQVAYMFQFALLLSDDSLPPAHPSSPRLLLEFTGRHAVRPPSLSLPLRPLTPSVSLGCVLPRPTSLFIPLRSLGFTFRTRLSPPSTRTLTRQPPDSQA